MTENRYLIKAKYCLEEEKDFTEYEGNCHE